MSGCSTEDHDFSHLYCINDACALYQVKGHGNIKLMGHFGTGKLSHQVYCTLCRKSMSERYGTVYFHSPLGPDEIGRIVRCLMEGNGIRGTARITGHSKDTIMRIVARAGNQAKAVMDEMLRELRLTEIQMDEFWTFVKKNRKTSPRMRSRKASLETRGST